MRTQSWASGWIGLAVVVMVLAGAVDLLQGLIAVLEDEYYVVTRSGFVVLDLTAWGWFLMGWGALLVLAGLALASAKPWARWFAIVGVSVNVLAQLGFLGNSEYPLWGLTALALNLVVLYAVTVRWEDWAEEQAFEG